MGSFQDHMLLAHKIESVMFLTLTLITNAALLMRYWYFVSRQLVRGPSHFIKITLSFGCMLMSGFTYFVHLLQVYEVDVYLSCTTKVLACVYGYSIFPFIFGVSIMFMACNACFRQYPFWSVHIKAITILTTVLPWILGIVIICPLNLVGMHWKDSNCGVYFSKSRHNALVVVTAILPACLALFSTILVIFISKKRRSNSTVLANFQNSTLHEESLQFICPDLEAPRMDQTTTNVDKRSDSACNFLEMIILFWSSLIFFFSVTPYSVYILRLINNTVEFDRTEYIAHDVCFHYFRLYPIIVPLLWIIQIRG